MVWGIDLQISHLLPATEVMQKLFPLVMETSEAFAVLSKKREEKEMKA